MAKENEVQVNEEVKEEKCLVIERETYQSKDSEERYSYFVKGVIRGKNVKASLIPGDIGGYDVLDIVFGEDKTAKLVLVPYSMVDEKTGKEIKGNGYEAQNTDEFGEVYKCKVKPRQSSDKALLEMLLARL